VNPGGPLSGLPGIARLIVSLHATHRVMSGSTQVFIAREVGKEKNGAFDRWCSCGKEYSNMIISAWAQGGEGQAAML
jgi:hypothetical protein